VAEIYLFSSRCLKCREHRNQYGCDAADIAELLRDDKPIEAQCAVCGSEWRPSVEERADLAGGLGVEEP
jgi:hypothetical protein